RGAPPGSRLRRRRPRGARRRPGRGGEGVLRRPRPQGDARAFLRPGVGGSSPPGPPAPGALPCEPCPSPAPPRPPRRRARRPVGGRLARAWRPPCVPAPATFALPGANVGIFSTTPAVGAARSVARKRVMERLLRGNPIDPATARGGGLVNRIAPAERLDEA